ncbi:hypothetical protein EJ06DRAFT_567484 [Trichodelitschia bisporula]|uniref:Uncharacterized protein n=1 Tax=Trichodelitschia bisporula TaxID=703511 RepID=A0A6G1HLT2_9PEZI|nr:hypothetical protein EJ06DRAFT_567484 [Trichodelitschia bisporula]
MGDREFAFIPPLEGRILSLRSIICILPVSPVERAILRSRRLGSLEGISPAPAILTFCAPTGILGQTACKRTATEIGHMDIKRVCIRAAPANVVLGSRKSSIVFDESQQPAHKRACLQDIKKPSERKFCRSMLAIPFKKSAGAEGIKTFTFEIAHDLTFILSPGYELARGAPSTSIPGTAFKAPSASASTAPSASVSTSGPTPKTTSGPASVTTSGHVSAASVATTAPASNPASTSVATSSSVSASSVSASSASASSTIPYIQGKQNGTSSPRNAQPAVSPAATDPDQMEYEENKADPNAMDWAFESPKMLFTPPQTPRDQAIITPVSPELEMIDAPGPNILLWPKAPTQPLVQKPVRVGDVDMQDAFPSPPPTPPYTQGPAAALFWSRAPTGATKFAPTGIKSVPAVPAAAQPVQIPSVPTAAPANNVSILGDGLAALSIDITAAPIAPAAAPGESAAEQATTADPPADDDELQTALAALSVAGPAPAYVYVPPVPVFVDSTDPDVPPSIPSKKPLKGSGKGVFKTSTFKSHKAGSSSEVLKPMPSKVLKASTATVLKASTAKPKKKLFQEVDAEMAAMLKAILPGLPKEFRDAALKEARTEPVAEEANCADEAKKAETLSKGTKVLEQPATANRHTKATYATEFKRRAPSRPSAYAAENSDDEPGDEGSCPSSSGLRAFRKKRSTQSSVKLPDNFHAIVAAAEAAEKAKAASRNEADLPDLPDYRSDDDYPPDAFKVPNLDFDLGSLKKALNEL